MKCNTQYSIKDKVKNIYSLTDIDYSDRQYNIFCNHNIVKKERGCYHLGHPDSIGIIQIGTYHEFRTFGSTYSLRISERADKSKNLSFRTKYDELVREGLIL